MRPSCGTRFSAISSRDITFNRADNRVASATGGLASLFAQGTELFHAIEDDLTMHGLVLINAYNKETV